MNKLRLVIGASVREQVRWARQHLYTLLILAPLVFGISYATVSRIASEAPPLQVSFPVSLAFAFGFVLSLVGLSLTRASGEIYHLRRPESMLDSLPVSLATQLHAACMKRVSRTIAVAALILIVHALTGAGTFFATDLLLLSLFVLVTSLVEVMSALTWIHWGHTRSKVVALNSCLTIIVSATLSGLLLLSIVRPDIVPVWIERRLDVGSAVWAGGLYFLIRELHQRWRAPDIEYAKRLEASGSLSLFTSRLLRKYFTRDIAVQLARDLQLTIRAFSSAVYVSLFVVVILFAGLITILITNWLPVAATPGWFEATWLPAVVASKIVCVLATASCSILVAVLVAYQLPHFWLERTAGATGKHMWETKLWYARLLSLPMPLIVWTISVLVGAVPWFYTLPLLLECVWLWWIVSTVIGALAFEVPERPELAIVLMISSGAVFGLFVSMFWPIGLALFALNGMRGLATRGHARAEFCLMTEGD